MYTDATCQIYRYISAVVGFVALTPRVAMASIASVPPAPARVASGRVERLRPHAGAARARNALGLRASWPARVRDTASPRAAEMMGVPLYADDLLEACAPWGNVCVVAGTHYIPIALPSIIASLFLFAPLVVVFLKLQSAEAKLVLANEKIESLEKSASDDGG